ncbi:ABC transporter permease [Terracidiphilus gabretensis]|uniref:ABC transporter permease n=1 Tax=Terracidiphilus gabretensis TaxID=1577687 RepID=UPI00071B5D48|nr:ABC transporter permease [Terracidiphilus gabretensis]
MRNILLVAKREYLEGVRGRAFRMSTILVPVVFAVIIAVAVFAGKNSGVGKHVLIATTDSNLAADIQSQLTDDKDSKTTVDVIVPSSPSERDSLVSKVREKEIDGLLWIDTAVPSKITATYISTSSGDIVIGSRLESALNHALAAERLSARGMSKAEVELVMKTVSVDTMQVDKGGKEVKSSGIGAYLKGYIMGIMLAMTTMIYGMNVARSIIQEKTSRIFEVMLASVKAGDLLAGKLLGIGAVGLTQLAIWGVAAALLAGSAFAAPVLNGQLSIHLSITEGLLFGAYFILGYLLYASLFAGLAASCETEQELQMYTPLAAVPIWLSFSLIWLIINNPSSFWSIAASLFPATAPIVMMLRMGAQTPPAWQFAASLAIMVVSVWAVLWVSARLYRVGILMYGKRATLPELLRWLRYS